MQFVPLLFLKNLLILGFLLWLGFKLYGCQLTLWRDVRIFVTAGVFFLLVAALVLWVVGNGDSWKAFVLLEERWTFAGDVAMLFIGGGYSLLAMALCRAFRIAFANAK